MTEKERYQQYLASREWWEKREAVRKRCGGICERCKWQPMSHVHHLTYIRKYHELLDDLQGLCDDCHAFTHAKSNYDPCTDAPVVFAGQQIRTVYLAGKISGKRDYAHREDIGIWQSDDWRYDFVEDSKWGLVRDLGDWDGDRLCLKPLPSGHKLRYTGPFFVDRFNGGHSGPEYGAPHTDGNVLKNAGQELCAECLKAIQRSDLVFAWIDSDSCFGTIAEIGFAFSYALENKRPIILIAGPTIYSQLWFSYNLADAVLFDTKSPWDSFLYLLSGRCTNFALLNAGMEGHEHLLTGGHPLSDLCGNEEARGDA